MCTNARGDHPLVVVGVDAHVVVLEVEGVLAELDVLQLVLVEVGPAPQPGVDHVGEAFTPRHLGTPSGVRLTLGCGDTRGVLWSR